MVVSGSFAELGGVLDADCVAMSKEASAAAADSADTAPVVEVVSTGVVSTAGGIETVASVGDVTFDGAGLGPVNGVEDSAGAEGLA